MSLDNFLAPGGLTVASLLMAILIAGSKGIWYYGVTVRELTKDRDDWKTIAIAATKTVKDQAEQLAALTEITETLAKASGPRRN